MVRFGIQAFNCSECAREENRAVEPRIGSDELAADLVCTKITQKYHAAMVRCERATSGQVS
jgi:hypothetical protein